MNKECRVVTIPDKYINTVSKLYEYLKIDTDIGKKNIVKGVLKCKESSLIQEIVKLYNDISDIECEEFYIMLLSNEVKIQEFGDYSKYVVYDEYSYKAIKIELPSSLLTFCNSSNLIKTIIQTKITKLYFRVLDFALKSRNVSYIIRAFKHIRHNIDLYYSKQLFLQYEQFILKIVAKVVQFANTIPSNEYGSDMIMPLLDVVNDMLSYTDFVKYDNSLTKSLSPLYEKRIKFMFACVKKLVNMCNNENMPDYMQQRIYKLTVFYLEKYTNIITKKYSVTKKEAYKIILEKFNIDVMETLIKMLPIIKKLNNYKYVKPGDNKIEFDGKLLSRLMKKEIEKGRYDIPGIRCSLGFINYRIFQAYFKAKNKVVKQEIYSICSELVEYNFITYIKKFSRKLLYGAVDSERNKHITRFYYMLRFMFIKYTQPNVRRFIVLYIMKTFLPNNATDVSNRYILFNNLIDKLYNAIGDENLYYYKEIYLNTPYIYINSCKYLTLINKEHNVNPILYIQTEFTNALYDVLKNCSMPDYIKSTKEFLTKIKKYPPLIIDIFMIKFFGNTSGIDDKYNIGKKLVYNYMKTNNNVNKLMVAELVSNIKMRWPIVKKNATSMRINSDLKMNIPNKSEYTFNLSIRDISKIFFYTVESTTFSTVKDITYIKSLVTILKKLILVKQSPITTDEFIDKFYLIDFLVCKIINLLILAHLQSGTVRNIDRYGSYQKSYIKKTNETIKNKNIKLSDITAQFEELIETRDVLIKLHHFYSIINLVTIFITKTSLFCDDTKFNRLRVYFGKQKQALEYFRPYYNNIYCPKLINILLIQQLLNSLLSGRHSYIDEEISILKFLRTNPSFNTESLREIFSTIKVLIGEDKVAKFENIITSNFDFNIQNNVMLSPDDFINFDIDHYVELINNPRKIIEKEEL